jgi:hypothetical protein
MPACSRHHSLPTTQVNTVSHGRGKGGCCRLPEGRLSARAPHAELGSFPTTCPRNGHTPQWGRRGAARGDGRGTAHHSSMRELARRAPRANASGEIAAGLLGLLEYARRHWRARPRLLAGLTLAATAVAARRAVAVAAAATLVAALTCLALLVSVAAALAALRAPFAAIAALAAPLAVPAALAAPLTLTAAAAVFIDGDPVRLVLLLLLLAMWLRQVALRRLERAQHTQVLAHDAAAVVHQRLSVEHRRQRGLEFDERLPGRLDVAGDGLP